MFASDNAAPVHPKIMEALLRCNEGVVPSYGADPVTKSAEAALQEVFERPCDVLFVATGTAANALSLAAMTPPWGAVICHRHAHIAEDEAGAPEFFMGGAKLLLIDGEDGKVTPEAVAAECQRYSRAWVHGAQPFAVSISQATEAGAAYTPEEVAALSETCRELGLKLHMDGARFGNVVAFLGETPAALSWRAGVDILSFGATKGGALGAEAIVCFDPALAVALPHLRKRAGHLLSKHRFIAAQIAAYLEDGLWLEMADNANVRARALGRLLEAAGAVLLHPVEANEVFARLSESLSRTLWDAGLAFHPWPQSGPGAFRFVASWLTSEEDVRNVARALGQE